VTEHGVSPVDDNRPSGHGVPPGSAARTDTPAEREAHWDLFVRFAIEAASEDKARASRAPYATGK
jgi:hypothetical protein